MTISELRTDPPASPTPADAAYLRALGSIDTINYHVGKLKAENRRLRHLLKVARESIPLWPGNPVITAIDIELNGGGR
jgi:hypothetical protein